MRISDWSSDVCSSDLQRQPYKTGTTDPQSVTCCRVALSAACKGSARKTRSGFSSSQGRRLCEWLLLASARLPSVQMACDTAGLLARRSAERRVGKDGVSTCRSGWSRYHKKKTMTNMMNRKESA